MTVDVDVLHVARLECVMLYHCTITVVHSDVWTADDSTEHGQELPGTAS